ncbi:YqfQ family protein [Neobacillus muris]|uniref:YqfQ family protein n=1 Tax=Neobacillus muris TaxID=2941334 RepID=UPI002041B59E|nr:YqfQ family protein [Neobacillus muris]
MQPRPNFPMQGGMRPGLFGAMGQMTRPGPGMMGGGNPMMGAGPGIFGGRNPMMGPSANPFGGMMGGRQMGRGGGLLSRLLGRGNPMGGPAGLIGGTQGAGRAVSGGGGLLQSLSNPGGITGILNNTQQVLKTAQTLGPMIQQYGPLVRNLPALWKLYRGFKNAPADTEESTANKTTGSKEESSNVKSFITAADKKRSRTQTSQRTAAATKDANKQQTRPVHQNQKGASIPKLYI